MSVVVIGLNHRTAPLDLLERTDDRRCPAAARPCTTSCAATALSRGGRAVDVQPHRGLRRRRAVPRRLRGRAQLLLRACRSCRPRSSPTTSTSTTTRTAVDPPVRGRRRARLGGGRRERDPRPGAARRGSGLAPRAPPAPRSTCCSATRSRSASGSAPRPASAAASRRWRTAAVAMADRPAGHARPAAACWCSAPARWARAWLSRSAAAASTTWHRGQPHVGHRAGDSPHASAGEPCACPISPPRSPRSMCCSRRPAQRTIMLEHADLATAMATRAGPAAAGRRHRRAARRRSRGRRHRRRRPARHGRPAALRRRRSSPSANARSTPCASDHRRGARPLPHAHHRARGGAAGHGAARAGRGDPSHASSSGSTRARRARRSRSVTRSRR